MGFNFKDLYNKGFAETGTKLNQGINKVLGKEVFGEVKKIEEPKTFAPLNSFPAYSVAEPKQWTVLEGHEKSFSIAGNPVQVSKNLDTCMQYVPLFKECAKYYSDRFAYRYEQCVTDYDSFLYYFQDMYFEGLRPMLDRAASLMLPFNIFNVNANQMSEFQINNYHKAIDSYNTMAGIVENRNQQAANLGNAVGNSVQFSGGGFGVKGAIKGAAKAGMLNAAVSGFGAMMANQTRMSDSEKANVFAKFNKEIFFQEVYYDYLNTFFTTIQFFIKNNLLGNISITTGESYNTVVTNLKNPMFPQDKVAPSIAQIIAQFPFTKGCYETAIEKFGETSEIKAVRDYFTI